MPDTKSGRERKGRNKRQQLESRLYRREVETLDEETELPDFDAADPDSELLASPEVDSGDRGSD
ncbi:MAG: hypothetical protein ABEJ79_10650 [Halolamina sp.]